MNYKIIKLLLLISWILVIFSFSMQNSGETTNTSYGFTKSIISISYKLIDSNADDNKINEVVESIHPLIRKLAHYIEFLILAIFVLLFLSEFNIKHIYIYSIIFCLFIAIFDESIQMFIDGRLSSIKDIFIDTLGSITYILIYKFIKR